MTRTIKTALKSTAAASVKSDETFISGLIKTPKASRSATTRPRISNAKRAHNKLTAAMDAANKAAVGKNAAAKGAAAYDAVMKADAPQKKATPSSKAFKAVKLAKIAEAQAQAKAARAARKELRLKQREQIAREDAKAGKAEAAKAAKLAALKAKDKATKKRTPAQKAKASAVKLPRPSLLTAVAEQAFSHARSSTKLLNAVTKAGGNIDPVKKAFYEGSIAHKVWPKKLEITEDMRAQVRDMLKGLSKMKDGPAKNVLTQAYSTARTYFARFCEKNGLPNLSPSGKGGKGRGRKPGASKAEAKAKKAIKAAAIEGSTDSKAVSPVTGDLTTQISPKKMTPDLYAEHISFVGANLMNFANRYAAHADAEMAELTLAYAAAVRKLAEARRIGTQPDAPNADAARAAEKLMELHKAKLSAKPNGAAH